MELWTALDAPGSFQNIFLNSYHNSDYKWFSNFVNLNSDSNHHIHQFFKSFSFKLPESEEEVPPIMIRIDRLWIQYKWMKYEKNISFAVESKKRKQWRNAAASLATGSIFEEAFLRNTWKGCLAGQNPNPWPYLQKIMNYFFFEEKNCANSKLNHIRFQNGGSQNGSPDIRYCIFSVKEILEYDDDMSPL